MPKPQLQLKRVYDKAEAGDGFRILVDRLWPRGVSKKEARIDLWLKDIAPSDPLRRWFGHDPAKWNEFQRRYRQELQANRAAVNELKKILDRQPVVTLLFAAADKARNNAVALTRLLKLESRRGATARGARRLGSQRPD